MAKLTQTYTGSFETFDEADTYLQMKIDSLLPGQYITGYRLAFYDTQDDNHPWSAMINFSSEAPQLFDAPDFDPDDFDPA